MSGGRRGVFLDRDGVLVRTFVRENRAYAPVRLEEFRIDEAAGGEVERLRQAGLIPIVFTNQQEVSRGTLLPETLAEMHSRLRAAVPVEDIFVCCHDTDDACDCRKPKPGLLRTAAEKWTIDLQRSFVVGDQWRDVEAGRAVGCYTILIERSYSGSATADERVSSLAGAVEAVLRKLGGRAC